MKKIIKRFKKGLYENDLKWPMVGVIMSALIATVITAVGLMYLILNFPQYVAMVLILIIMVVIIASYIKVWRDGKS